MPPHRPQTLILATAATALLYTLWQLTPHAAIMVARQAQFADQQPWTSNATLMRLRARKQLRMDHRPYLLFTAAELLMFYHERAGLQADNRTRRVWNRQREFDRVMVPRWLRRLRLWWMVD